MKGTFFSKPIEWNIETIGESWKQGDSLRGLLRVRNHGQDDFDLSGCGVSLSYAEIKKVQSRAEGALKSGNALSFDQKSLPPGGTTELSFQFPIDTNGPVTDKKASYYLTYGKNQEAQLQVKVGPMELFSRIIGLLDTFHRFKVKEFKGTKKGVEYKLIPPTSREMANLESLLLTFSMEGEDLLLKFNFVVKKLDTSSVTTKVNKEEMVLEKRLSPKEYKLGKDMLNQDVVLKRLAETLDEVKLKNVF
jgi:hypothetical protein